MFLNHPQSQQKSYDEDIDNSNVATPKRKLFDADLGSLKRRKQNICHILTPTKDDIHTPEKYVQSPTTRFLQELSEVPSAKSAEEK